MRITQREGWEVPATERDADEKRNKKTAGVPTCGSDLAQGPGGLQLSMNTSRQPPSYKAPVNRALRSNVNHALQPNGSFFITQHHTAGPGRNGADDLPAAQVKFLVPHATMAQAGRWGVDNHARVSSLTIVGRCEGRMPIR
ncbi:hypothetical protein LA080_000388 [Diaporthe eres]|nr:hypothetical protein LA080_000388 [Diaporthe eres]